MLGVTLWRVSPGVVCPAPSDTTAKFHGPEFRDLPQTSVLKRGTPCQQ